MRDLFEAIAEYMSAEGVDARREHAKKVRIECDLVQDRMQQMQSRIEALEKDAARLDWIDKVGRVNIERVREGHKNGHIRWDVEYGYYDDFAKSKKGLREAIDTAMQSEKGGV